MNQLLDKYYHKFIPCYSYLYHCLNLDLFLYDYYLALRYLFFLFLVEDFMFCHLKQWFQMFFFYCRYFVFGIFYHTVCLDMDQLTSKQISEADRLADSIENEDSGGNRH